MALVATGCDAIGEDFFSPVTTDPPSSTIPASTTTAPSVTTTTVFVPDLSSAAATWSASLRAVGPFQIGMTIPEAEAAAGTFLTEVDDQDPACSYYVFAEATGVADQIRFMVRADEITRVDIDGTVIKTLSGAGVGSTTSEVRGTYGEAIVVSPGDSGNANNDNLTYIPTDQADLDYRLRFEAIDDVVTTFRVGKVPEVEWVGRCQ